jgi:predicted metal-dependent hydrolase
LWKDPRLEKYFPDAVGIAKPSEKKELRGTGITFTSRGGVNVSTAPQVTNQEVLDVWDKNKEKLEQALDAMDDANMRKLFEEYKDIFSLRAAAQPEGR